MIFQTPKLRCVDLSNNHLHKLGAEIGKALKLVNHIQWIDLTQNLFYNDDHANNLILQSLKKQS